MGELFRIWTRQCLAYVVVSLMVLFSPFEVSAQTEIQVDELIRKATETRASGQLRKSLTALQTAHALRPQPLLLNNMGKLHEELGEYDLAVANYRKVTNDPAASTELRMLDAARISALEPKLSRAWVRVGPGVSWAQVRVDHVYCPIEGEVEVAVTPGERIVEIEYAGRREAGLYRLNLRAGRRQQLTPEVLEAVEPRGKLLVIGLSPRPVSMTVGEYTLDVSMSRLDQLSIPSGEARIRLMAPNGKWMDLEKKIAAAETVSLEALAGVGWKDINRTGQLSTEAVGYSRDKSGGLKLMTATLGATLVGSGLFLYFDVEEGRSILMDEGRSPDITIHDAAARWESLNSRAAVGGILTGLGGAVVVGTAFWWWNDRETKGALTSNATDFFPQPWCVGDMCGLSVGGPL